MDRAKPSRGYTKKFSKGIAIRHWENSTTIRITFCYQGVECNETLSLPATKANLQYAERLRSSILHAIEKNQFNYGEYFPRSKRAQIFGGVNQNPFIGDRLTQFLALAEKTLEKSTVIGYKKVCRAHLFPTFAKMPMRSLTPDFLQTWLLELKVSLKATRNILIPLRAILNDAIHQGILSHNPLDKIVLKKLLKKTAKKKTYQAQPFSRAEIQTLLAHADEALKPLIQFVCFTGLRISEWIALEWQDIDWVEGVAHIQRAVVAKEEKETKTEAGKREVLLLPPALEALRAQKAYTFLQGKRVFHNPKSQKPWVCDNQFRECYWRPLFKLSGVPYRSPYQMRHTYASLLLSAGENMLWASRQMGHRDTEMIIKNYTKWIPDPNAKKGYQFVSDWSNALRSS